MADFLGDTTLSKALDLFVEDEGVYRAGIRVSNLYLGEENLYYLHSAFPTNSDSVFFGPDTYLYLEFLKAARSKPRTVVDVCCGAGAGAIHIARQFPDAKVLGLDLNQKALDLAAVNSQHAGVQVQFKQSDLFSESPDDIDLIISNPPYIASAEDVAVYANGGASGLELSLRIVDEGLRKLAAGGLLMIYTGVAISLSGKNPFREYLKDLEVLEYRILHPDMWPEEIGKGAYVDVGRIEVVGVIIRKS
ncbi:hypothetical protein LTS18_004170 [Coniosporium uncinatum]|uniref:Uncharacterized protein n=1 Tax=Coniosporium uncinatum TaxID=93489 RepID=A0ACC3D644_9PEZI|nr:hypothetical protein LTS18_004170 [Coniosporium uncinatum]